MIKTNNITKLFRTDEIETTALDSLNIEVQEGEFVAIMGPSGCGKSTLLSILGLLDKPNSGELVFLEQSMSKLSEKQMTKIRKENIGFIFQTFNLLDELTVFENVELPLIYQGMSKAERNKKVEVALEKMDIDHRKNHFPGQLSGGQRQRVAVARAVVIEPRLILADEPTGNLDSKNGEEVMSLLAKLNQEGSTIIMVTHSLSNAQHARRIIKLLDGKVIDSAANDFM